MMNSVIASTIFHIYGCFWRVAVMQDNDLSSLLYFSLEATSSYSRLRAK